MRILRSLTASLSFMRSDFAKLFLVCALVTSTWINTFFFFPSERPIYCSFEMDLKKWGEMVLKGELILVVFAFLSLKLSAPRPYSKV